VVCLGHRSGGVVTNQGGFLTRGRSRLTGGASSQFVMNGASLVSPYGAFGSAVTSQGGLLTRGWSRLTGGASSQFVTIGASPVSPYEAPPVGVFYTSGSVSDLGSGGVSLHAEGGELTSMNGGGFSCLTITLGCILGV